MVTIGWPMLLLLLIIGLRLGGVSLGLLSGLGLGVLTFFVQPAAPPNDLMLLQATWLLLMATLEATGFFYLLETKLRSSLMQTCSAYGWLMALFCYGLVFLTGDKKWVHRWVCDPDRPPNAKLRFAMGIAAHMALLASPLSISGILLIVTAGNSGLAILDLVGTIVAITASLTAVSGLLVGFIPDRWQLALWPKPATQDNVEVVPASTGKVQLAFLLVLLAEVLFLLIKPEVHRATRLSSTVFPVRLPIFFALVMLSIAAVAMLGWKIKPAQILQTNRFKSGIQQFFIFLGLTWLLDSLISHDKTALMSLLSGGNGYYGFYFMAPLYLLLIDMSMVIWLFMGLLLAPDCTTLTLALWLVGIHSLAPIRCWLSKIAQVKK
ncbi:MAG: anaerobic C4-dicarboxylate transporter family protein [Candidatus Cardinium sp.]|uniref:anaerobic C4-dicarboxylate transporter family protein n=1 Tax=Candidatus Cardinium sp. TP TaxID=2961955 RepID=UPI0021AF3E4E|nr:anaerobic C4-dicarboxylate transporter family protein [Candidatus Cardinium sp. TP]MCT4696779.1 hypothetical protein [Candidatus Cardinium sp. TP]